MAIEVLVDAKEFQSAGPRQRAKLRELKRLLQEKPFLGEHTRREIVPPRFRDLPNLHRLALPDAWRALYTVRTDARAGRSIYIVWIGDHKRYERLFGY